MADSAVAVAIVLSGLNLIPTGSEDMPYLLISSLVNLFRSEIPLINLVSAFIPVGASTPVAEGISEEINFCITCNPLLYGVFNEHLPDTLRGEVAYCSGFHMDWDIL